MSVYDYVRDAHRHQAGESTAASYTSEERCEVCERPSVTATVRRHDLCERCALTLALLTTLEAHEVDSRQVARQRAEART